VAGTPGEIIWPPDSKPKRCSNIKGVQFGDYKWVTYGITPGECKLSTLAPNGFVIGIGFVGIPARYDAIEVDEQGVSRHDWICRPPKDWEQAPCGVNMIRALLTDRVVGVETLTLGAIRAMYK
jgi:hypothetical protein